MATLKARLEVLELTAPSSCINYCMIVHSGGDCETARAAAKKDYMAQHGSVPTKFIDVHLVAPGDGVSRCNCSPTE